MKVVLFCGGLGTRLREYSDTVPKPMVNIGQRPIIWHLMKYYAHFGHTEFILCLGYRGEVIKQYFLNYDECLSNDFRLMGGNRVELYGRDIDNWKITFADTGLHSNIGQRLKTVQRYIADDDVFLANYSDGLTDLPLDDYLRHFQMRDKIGSFVCVHPSHSFHAVSVAADGLVRDLRPAVDSNLWINGGFFAFKREIFDYLKDGEELVLDPFQRLIARKELIAYRHEGFWACMDTFKDKQAFDDMNARGDTPWQLWRSDVNGRPPRTAAPGAGGHHDPDSGASSPGPNGDRGMLAKVRGATLA